MTTTIKYIGASSAYFESAITGKQSVWKTGQVESRDDVEAQLLLRTGLFTAVRSAEITAVTDPVTGGVMLFDKGSLIRNCIAPVSQYDKALIMAVAARQMNAVRDLSQNINDAQVVGAITNAELYETEVGAFAIGMATSKALAFDCAKMYWDLSAGESLLVQARVKTVGATTSSNVLFGNSDGAAAPGFGLVLYGPSHATTPGKCAFNYKGGASGISLTLTPYTQTASAVVVDTSIGTDVYHNYTLFIDGATKMPWLSVDGRQCAPQAAIALTDSKTTDRNFGLGHIPTDLTFTSSAAKAARFQSFRYAVFPATKPISNVHMLDYKFNANPYVLFTDADYLGEGE